MGTSNIIIDLDKEKAIDIIIRLDSHVRFDTFIDCDCSREELEKELDELEWSEFDNLKSDCFRKQKELEKERERLSRLAYHEILEIGEEKGLWKQSEKQKRLSL